MTLTRTKPGQTHPLSPDHRMQRILYVEDEDPNWEIADYSLRNRFNMVRARNAREAFDIIVRGEFAAILMDIQLAGSEFNGIEITKILRGDASLLKGAKTQFQAEPLTLPIIFVTAYNARYSKEELLKAGGDDMIPKPVDFTRLALVLSKLSMRALAARSLRAQE